MGMQKLEPRLNHEAYRRIWGVDPPSDRLWSNDLPAGAVSVDSGPNESLPPEPAPPEVLRRQAGQSPDLIEPMAAAILAALRATLASLEARVSLIEHRQAAFPVSAGTRLTNLLLASRRRNPRRPTQAVRPRPRP
jgi:hypothetical protein